MHGTLAIGADGARELLEPLDVHVDYLFGAKEGETRSASVRCDFVGRDGPDGAFSGDGRGPVQHGDWAAI